MELLPKTIRHKAKYLLQGIKNIDWTSYQELVVNGNVSRNSNKYDLLKYATETKHTKFTLQQPPLGWKEFKHVIEKSNVPITLLGNAVLEKNKEEELDSEDENPFRKPKVIK